MSNAEVKKLCMNLIHADSEQDVIDILESAGYWGNTDLWRYYADYETNYNQIGNQQSSPDAAFVEKVINSVDARLTNECLVRGVDPEGPAAPQSIQDAVAVLIRGSKPGKEKFSGRLTEWSRKQRREEAQNITVSATGFKPDEGKLCLTISDRGEGQTPDKMPETFLSLTKANKRRIPFVQGKFNMGGTGVLKFCGYQNLQLIVSRRNPELVSDHNPSDVEWGFTVVRRESPTGNIRSSDYTYLAPVESETSPRAGKVLRFRAKSLPIFPVENQPYVRDSEWGTLIKLYEYDLSGSKSNILRKSGLLSRLDLLMPEVALPVRLHECRDYGGKKGSYDTTLTGLKTRLELEKAGNLEDGCPWASPLTILGEKIMATIYAFKRDRAAAYKKSEGILFTITGQTHGNIPKGFFRRKSVGLGYLKDSLLVVLNCNAFTVRSFEDLFMNSRDRLRDVELRREIEDRLSHMLKHHEGLRALQAQRRREEIEERIGDERPLEEVLRNLLRDAPILYNLFLSGARISNPFKKKKVTREEKPWDGKRFPTYFHFKGKEQGERLERDCPIDKDCRVAFETDAENDYFDRQFDPGEFTLYIEADGHLSELSSYDLNLHNGIATLSLRIPDNCEVGDTLNFEAVATDPSRVDPFENLLTVRVLMEAGPRSGGKSTTRKPPSKKDGQDDDSPSGIQLPKMTRVYEEPINGSKAWNNYDPPFDRFTALRIVNAGTESDNGEGEKEIYDFFINMDNIYLKSELKTTKHEPEVLRAKFLYGMVLIGLGLLQQDVAKKKDDYKPNSDEEYNVEDQVETVSKALAPVLLPMINSLGALDRDQVEAARFDDD